MDVGYPFQRILSFEVDNDDKTLSRFYFKARTKSSIDHGVTQEVFLKVWRADVVDIESVESEWMSHHQAYKAGVPVAAPILSGLARSTCCCGIDYLLFAVAFIKEDRIETIEQLWQFCRSLVETVLTLHQKAKMLHGDLKLANLRWSDGLVRLIDFEHAQDITNATWAPGTVGYQAPEIMDGMPCSMRTDAFSVGKVISKRLEKLKEDYLLGQQKHLCDILRNISLRLTDSNPERRWTLSKALDVIQDKHVQRMTVTLPASGEVQTKNTPVISPLH